MITRITIENFMSHRRTIIEPGEGLTVLTGPNNCGKSAVVLALQTLCSNERGMSKFVRHGQKQARVAVETDDRHKIEWVFEGGSVRYVVDGVRTDRSVVPDDMMPKLRLPEVCGDDGKTFDIHFAEQKEPVFLLSGGSRAATFFAASSDAGYLVKMQQVLRARKVEQNSLQRDLKARVAERERQLEPFEPLPEIEAELGLAQRTYDELSESFATMAHLDGLASALADCEVRRLREASTSEVLEGLEPAPMLGDEASLRKLTERLTERHRELDAASRRTTCLRELGDLPELEDAIGLQAMIAAISNRERQLRLLEARLASVEALEAPVPLIADPYLEQTVASLDALLAREERARSEALAANREAKKALEDLRSYVKVHPTCPVCGGEMSAEAVLAQEHAHA